MKYLWRENPLQDTSENYCLIINEITQHYSEETEAFHISAVRSFYYITGLSDLDAESTSLPGHQIIGYEIGGLKKKRKFN